MQMGSGQVRQGRLFSCTKLSYHPPRSQLEGARDDEDPSLGSVPLPPLHLKIDGPVCHSDLQRGQMHRTDRPQGRDRGASAEYLACRYSTRRV